MILEFAPSVGAVPAEEWDRCAGSENPFVSHAFLTTLEESGCVGERKGWIPYPGVLRESAGSPVLAVCPCYIKLHSKGEYIFDYHWADAYHRLHPENGSYYPKLQVAVPFTPVPGPRLLIPEDTSAERALELRGALLNGLQQAGRQMGCSSVHLTFCLPEEYLTAREQTGYLGRLGEQYHWFNEGYESFDDFLATLTSRKRKTIRKEREKANAHPLSIRTVHGSELTSHECRAFYRMYHTTSMQKWGQPYLNLEFFTLLARRMGERLVIFLVENEEGRPVAGAWNLRGDKALFGRNWGCLEYFDLLHFEVCYYRAIEYAIDHRLERVEAGAQGMHKIQRGYRPRPVYSVHHIESAPFRQAIAQYLRAERQETEFRLDALSDLEPFKNLS